MGILIQFPQPGTRTQPGTAPTSQRGPHDLRLAVAYRRDLDRAVALLLEHVRSDAYDGVALILKPASRLHKPALVVGGLYRHRLEEAADATMQLHLALKLRAREQTSGSRSMHMRDSAPPAATNEQEVKNQDMHATLQERWNEVTSRYRRCEQMVRIAFSKQLRASPETTAILLSITQLHTEIVANCLVELARQPGRETPQTKLETLNAIQLFRNASAQVSAWMPPPGQEEAYFAANANTLSEEMLCDGDLLLAAAETALSQIAIGRRAESVGT